MGAVRAVAGRQRRGHVYETGSAVSGRDSTGRADAGPTVTVRVPLAFRKRRGRKVLVAPDGPGRGAQNASPSPTRTQHKVTPAVRALARAFRWRRLLETGVMANVHEIAAAENINSSYVSRVVRLTMLSPDMVEALAAGTELSGANALYRLTMPIPVDWSRQRSLGS